METIFSISSIVGVFAIFDAFMKDPPKAKIAGYVFGRKSVDLRTFESTLIRGLLSIVMQEGKLSVYKTLIYSVGFMVGFFAFVFVNNIVSGTPEKNAEFNWTTLPILVALGALLFPLDYISFKITKSIFFDRELRFVESIIAVFLDAMLSLICASVILYVSAKLFELALLLVFVTPASAVFGMVSVLIFFSGLVSLISSVFLNLVQISVLILGMISRVLVTTTRLNLVFAKYTNAEKLPFTYIGLLLGTVLQLLSVLNTWFAS